MSKTPVPAPPEPSDSKEPKFEVSMVPPVHVTTPKLLTCQSSRVFLADPEMVIVAPASRLTPPCPENPPSTHRHSHWGLRTDCAPVPATEAWVSIRKLAG